MIELPYMEKYFHVESFLVTILSSFSLEFSIFMNVSFCKKIIVYRALIVFHIKPHTGRYFQYSFLTRANIVTLL